MPQPGQTSGSTGGRTWGRSWWGQRFLAALEELTEPGRLGRGRSYASNGKVTRYAIEGHTVQARVRGSVNPYYGVYKEPLYETTIAMTRHSADDWSRLIGRIGSRADLVTKLLQHEMPDPIEEVFAAEGLHLLPRRSRDLVTTCSCPDYSNPCKHVAGVYYLLAADLDRDPFLLFALRGLAQDDLHAELVKSPLGKVLASALVAEDVSVEPTSSYYTRPTKESAGAAASQSVSHREFWIGARRLPPTERTAPARVSALLVKKAGDYPPFWPKDGSFIATMEELYERVRTKSRQLT